MIKCTVCYAWHPEEWDGSKGHWADTVARCEAKDKFITASDSCGSAGIVKPKAIAVHVRPKAIGRKDERVAGL
jgi:hypothetical protein